jgi:hypothetical protein
MKHTEGEAGRYDAIATRARAEAEADSVVLIVVDGKHGMGFSVQERTDGQAPRLSRSMLAELLRNAARLVEGGFPATGVTVEQED